MDYLIFNSRTTPRKRFIDFVLAGIESNPVVAIVLSEIRMVNVTVEMLLNCLASHHRHADNAIWIALLR